MADKPRKVRQACDSCHARKTRCDGRRPCHGCQDAGAECTYLAVPKKTGPKGGPRRRRPLHPAHPPAPAAAAVPPCILRRASPQSSSSSSPLPLPLHPPPPSSSHLPPPPPPLPDGSPDDLPNGLRNGFLPSPRLSPPVMCWGIDAFFEHKYPITPILHRPHVEESLHRIACSPDAYALLTSCCAVLSLSPDILPKPPSPGSPSPILVPPTDFLLSETARARRYCNVAESQSLLHIQTSFFLFSAFFCMNKDDAAWFYLRESITMLQTLRLHEEATYSLLDPVDAAYGRRLFWVLFITERAYALQRHRPLTLQNTLALPCASPLCNDSDIMPGFLDLISLFGHFDTDFIASWNSSVPLAQPSESTHLSLLQELLKYALPSVSSYAPAQQADLLISQQWLKVMVWKHCVSKALLKTASGDDSMSLTYPASIARDVVLISKLLPTKAFEANGVGILEKIFDVGCSLADLVLLRAEANSASTMEVGPLDTLVELASILVTTLQGEFRHSGVLIDKVNQCLLMNVDRGLCLPEVEVLGDLESIESAVLGDEIIPF